MLIQIWMLAWLTSVLRFKLLGLDHVVKKTFEGTNVFRYCKKMLLQSEVGNCSFKWSGAPAPAPLKKKERRSRSQSSKYKGAPLPLPLLLYFGIGQQLEYAPEPLALPGVI